MNTNSVKAYSLHIGLNRVDPDHYSGWTGDLVACEADATDMRDLAQSMKYSKSELLLNEQATREAVISKLLQYAETLQKGDMLLITYSGHGGQVPDKDGDEEDGKDETWCLYNGELIDDELFNIWLKFSKGVRVWFISDSCHSGTMIRARAIAPEALLPKTEINNRALPASIAQRTYRNNKDFYDSIITEPKDKVKKSAVKATIREFSACMDNQVAQDGTFNGLFTGTLLQVWNEGKFKGNFRKFYKKILNLMPADQSPQHRVSGTPDEQWEKMRPFTY